jgi:hypothetical protein
LIVDTSHPLPVHPSISIVETFRVAREKVRAGVETFRDATSAPYRMGRGWKNVSTREG